MRDRQKRAIFDVTKISLCYKGVHYKIMLVLFQFLRRTKDLDPFLKSNQSIPFTQKSHWKEKSHSTAGPGPAHSQFTSNAPQPLLVLEWKGRVGEYRRHPRPLRSIKKSLRQVDKVHEHQSKYRYIHY